MSSWSSSSTASRWGAVLGMGWLWDSFGIRGPAQAISGTLPMELGTWGAPALLRQPS